MFYKKENQKNPYFVVIKRMSNSKELISFFLLRNKVVALFVAKNPSVSSNVSDWTGQNIVAFQEDLLEQVNTTISEKWFYTYFKQKELTKLPRIDMLNILSEYVGAGNWQQFLEANITKDQEGEEPSRKLALTVAGVIILLLLAVYALLPKTKEYRFCFIDKDVNLPITTSLEIQIIKKGESPVYFNTAENGCFSYKSKDKMIQFIVESPYYKSDTITRYYQSENNAEDVKLAADEYALILHYFSTNNVEDWNNRRAELGRMISDEAIIYQVFGKESFGIDILSKEAFINKITLPTSSLRNMKIIEIERNNNQIVKLKFETKLDYE